MQQIEETEINCTDPASLSAKHSQRGLQLFEVTVNGIHLSKQTWASTRVPSMYNVSNSTEFDKLFCLLQLVGVA